MSQGSSGSERIPAAADEVNRLSEFHNAENNRKRGFTYGLSGSDQNARGNIGPYCKACPVCNGAACGSTMPGPGAKGTGKLAMRNYEKWQEIRINMDTIYGQKAISTQTELFGKTFSYPVFAGPVGAVKLHYGEKYADQEYNEILLRGCAEKGIAAFTGDGTDYNVMIEATDAIGKLGGL